MDRQQQMVREFMVALDQPAPKEPAELPEQRLRLRLLLVLEEALELVQASGHGVFDTSFHVESGIRKFDVERTRASIEGDHLEQIDALVDILYVVYGMAIEMGVDLEPFFDEVHAANMRKVGGPTDANGKRGKPTGWVPPDIAGVYARLYDDK